MAKSKKKVIDEEEPISQATDAEVDFDVSASEVAADADAEADAEADADVDAETEGADVEAEPDAEADGGDAEDAVQSAEKPGRPRAKLTWLTIVLILLNWVAVPAFAWFFYLDHTVRLQYTFLTLLNYAQIQGVPLADEKEHPSISNETRPVMRLTQAQLTEAFRKRGGNTAMAKDFQAVDEPVPVHLTVGDMTDEMLLGIYGTSVPAAERYATLEAAIEDLRKKLPGVIAKASDEVKAAFKAKKEEEKRAFVSKSIFIMTWDTGEVMKMEEQIKNASGKDLDDLVKRALVQKILFPIALDYSEEKDGRRYWLIERIEEGLAKANGEALDALVDEAIQRRIYYDILAPINLFRPGDLKVTDVERIADRDKVKMERVKELLDKRLAAAVASRYDLAYHIGPDAWGTPQERDSIEKRQSIGFILFTLGQVQVPLLEKKLFAKGIERAQMVSGLYEFTNASIAYVQALRVLEQRRESRIVESRDGATFASTQGVPMRIGSFLDEQPAQIDRLESIVDYLEAGQKRLGDLKAQRDNFKKLYDQRLVQHKEVSDKLIKARQGTEKYAKELRGYQDRLHEALLELSDAADTNFRLEAEIRALELNYLKTAKQKGGKKAP